MKKTVLSLLLSLSVMVKVAAQLFFTPGYVVTQAGDTLRGELKEKDNATLFFRVNNGLPARSYTPEQLVAYSTENKMSRSANWLENELTRRVFMHELIDGPVSLLELVKPEPRLSYAIRLPNQTVVPLRGQLALILLTQHLNECKDPKFLRLLSTQTFFNGRGYFDQVINAYNACVGGGKSAVNKPKKVFHYEVGLTAGLAINSWYYGATESRFLYYWSPNGTYSANYTGAFGSYFTLAPQKRMSLTVEGLFTTYNGDQTVPIYNPLDPTDKRVRYYSFQETYLAFPITARYIIGTKPVRWYLKAGFAPSYGLSAGGQYSGDGITRGVIPIRAGIGIGYLAGLGVEVPFGKKQLLIELRTVPHIIADNVTRLGTSRSFQFTVSLPVFKK